MLPVTIRAPLVEHLAPWKAQHDADWPAATIAGSAVCGHSKDPSLFATLRTSQGYWV